MATAPKTTKKMPKGGRKGGAVFPRIDLEQAAGYAKRLVSKTHTGVQPRDIIFPGVLDTKGPQGEVRISALKQYGFAKGDSKAGFEATPAAKKMASAPSTELVTHYRKAALSPRIFKALFDTYHGDKVSKAKLKQRAADLNVHPDQTDKCVDNYLASVQLAQLVTVDGDDYIHISQEKLAENESSPGPVIQDSDTDDASSESTESDTNGSAGSDEQIDDTLPNAGDQPPPRAIFNVNVSLDSSLDTEKLEKQLALLKKFGAI